MVQLKRPSSLRLPPEEEPGWEKPPVLGRLEGFHGEHLARVGVPRNVV